MTNLTKILFLAILAVVAICQEEHEEHEQTDISQTIAWVLSVIVNLACSILGLLAALLILVVKKCISQSSFKIFINMLYSLGCGALVGDAMVHILPEAYSNAQTNFRFVSLTFICAVAFFVIMERLFHLCGLTHSHWGEEQHHHSEEEEVKVKDQNLKKNERLNQSQLIQVRKVQSEVNIKLDPKAQKTDKTIANSKNPEQDQQKKEENWLDRLKGKGSAGYLNILSSLLHNFFDGFAIGAALSSRSKTQYIPVIVAIFAHQVPREMADVAILMKNNFDGVQTILCNIFVNITSLIGGVVGMALGSISEATQLYILAFVAGNFIYIAADIWRNLLKNKSACANILEFCSFIVGVGAMYLVLLAESGGEHEHQ